MRCSGIRPLHRKPLCEDYVKICHGLQDLSKTGLRLARAEERLEEF